MPSQSETEYAFSEALNNPAAEVPQCLDSPPGSTTLRRFGIYRNNHVAGLIDALTMTFPVLLKLVGVDFFNAAAAGYIRQYPPKIPVLLLYGETFGDYLDQLPAAKGVPYLGDMARFEWTRIFSLNARDLTSITIQHLADTPADELTRCVLDLHPSVRLLESRWPVHDILRECIEGVAHPSVDMTEPARLLIARIEDDVVAWPIAEAGFILFSALSQGKLLGEAMILATQHDPDFDLSNALAFLFGNSLVAGLRIQSTEEASTFRRTE